MKIIKEFKEFAVKGNVLQLAIAVIIGTAFGKIISALVDNIIMPIIGTIIGSNFAALTTTVNGVQVKYGLFIQATVDFFIVAFVLFLIIKVMNRMKEPAILVKEEPAISNTDQLLMEIRDELKKSG